MVNDNTGLWTRIQKAERPLLCYKCKSDIEQAVLIIEKDPNNSIFGVRWLHYCKSCFKKEFVNK